MKSSYERGTAQAATLSTGTWQPFQIQTKGQDEKHGKGVMAVFVLTLLAFSAFKRVHLRIIKCEMCELFSPFTRTLRTTIISTSIAKSDVQIC